MTAASATPLKADTVLATRLPRQVAEKLRTVAELRGRTVSQELRAAAIEAVQAAANELQKDERPAARPGTVEPPAVPESRDAGT